MGLVPSAGLVVRTDSTGRLGERESILPRQLRPRQRARAVCLLRYLFEELPKASTAEAVEALLPWNVKPVLRVNSYGQSPVKNPATFTYPQDRSPVPGTQR